MTEPVDREGRFLAYHEQSPLPSGAAMISSLVSGSRKRIWTGNKWLAGVHWCCRTCRLCGGNGDQGITRSVYVGRGSRIPAISSWSMVSAEAILERHSEQPLRKEREKGRGQQTTSLQSPRVKKTATTLSHRCANAESTGFKLLDTLALRKSRSCLGNNARREHNGTAQSRRQTDELPHKQGCLFIVVEA